MICLGFAAELIVVQGWEADRDYGFPLDPVLMSLSLGSSFSSFWLKAN